MKVRLKTFNNLMPARSGVGAARIRVSAAEFGCLSAVHEVAITSSCIHLYNYKSYVLYTLEMYAGKLKDKLRNSIKDRQRHHHPHLRRSRRIDDHPDNLRRHTPVRTLLPS